jgi:hypothetical protein
MEELDVPALSSMFCEWKQNGRKNLTCKLVYERGKEKKGQDTILKRSAP